MDKEIKFNESESHSEEVIAEETSSNNQNEISIGDVKSLIKKQEACSKAYSLSPTDLELLLESIHKDEISENVASQVIGGKSLSKAETIKKIQEEKESKDNKYYFKNYHYQQQTSIGCSVSCYLMAKSILKKGSSVSYKNEKSLVDELMTQDLNRVELSTLVNKAVKDGFFVEIFYSGDPSKPLEDSSFDKLRNRYFDRIESLKKDSPQSLRDFNNLDIDENLIKKTLREGKPVLINGITEDGILHARLITGYDKDLFIVDDPLKRSKITMDWSSMKKLSTTPTGVWLMSMDVRPQEVKKSELNKDNFAKVNINYHYLNTSDKFQLEVDPYTIPDEVISPIVRDMIRRGKDPQLIDKNLFKNIVEKATPNVMSTSDFIRNLNESFSDKIDVQQQIREFINNYMMTGKMSINEANRLIEKSKEVESHYYGYGSLVKEHINFCLSKLKYLNEEDLKLVLTPSKVPAQVENEYVMANLAYDKIRGKGVNNKYALELFYNNDISYFASELDKRVKQIDMNGHEKVIDNINNTYNHFLKNTKNKNQFVIERNIPNVKEIDYLLNFDNNIEKYFDYKKCFLHDVFLRVIVSENIKNPHGKIVINKENIAESLNIIS